MLLAEVPGIVRVIGRLAAIPPTSADSTLEGRKNDPNRPRKGPVSSERWQKAAADRHTHTHMCLRACSVICIGIGTMMRLIFQKMKNRSAGKETLYQCYV